MTLFLCNKRDIEKYGISIGGGMEERRGKHQVISGRVLAITWSKNLVPSVKFLSLVHGSDLVSILVIEM